MSVLTRYFPVDEVREGYHRKWRTSGTFELQDTPVVQQQGEEVSMERALNHVARRTGVPIRSLRMVVEALEIASEGN